MPQSEIGAVLQQLSNGTWHPTAFFSMKLKPTECRNSTLGHELLAVYSSVRNFRHFLEGAEFFILTDHTPLTYALRSMRSDGGTHTARELQQLAYISEFTTDIRHIKGRDNVIADALSWSAINAANDPERGDSSPKRRRSSKKPPNNKNGPQATVDADSGIRRPDLL